MERALGGGAQMEKIRYFFHYNQPRILYQFLEFTLKLNNMQTFDRFHNIIETATTSKIHLE